MVERRKRGSLDFVATVMRLDWKLCATIQAIINQRWQQKCPRLQLLKRIYPVNFFILTIALAVISPTSRFANVPFGTV